ncbi:MAG TPA: 2-phospho-L-lactate guanylyltransferase [Nitrososphaeraceae archaeon]|nr:2-phospho-L-lactate guanylyltransferase [Nitrososphaeraceae archaeon]
MKVAAVVPVKNFDKSKSRLSPLLNSNQRIAMSQVMMKHTLSILSKITFISPIIVVSSDNRVRKIADTFGADFVYEQETGVNAAVMTADLFCLEKDIHSNMVIPIDLCMLNPDDIKLIYDHSMKFSKSIALCPSSRLDGTNFLFRTPLPLFETSYENNSYYNHLSSAMRSKAHLTIINSVRLERDIDTVQDIIDVISLYPTSNLVEIFKIIMAKGHKHNN